jgi:hypothetical protein
MVSNNSNDFTPEELEWYHELRDSLPGDKKIKSDTKADVLCVNHGDVHPSLGFDLAKNGNGAKVLINCRSQGCSFEEAIAALGFDSRDLSFEEQENGRQRGCSLADYATFKHLPLEFLQSDTVGLQDTSWWGVDAIELPYVNPEGDYVLSRYRISLTTSPKVVSKKGDPTMLYGLHYLEDALAKGYVLICEGESDCHSAWYRGIPAMGVPGVGNWREEWAHYFDDIPRILVLVEPGAGEELWEKISATKALRGRVRRIDP